ncbi:serine/threonine protein phosphatase 6 regulatory ankyrin repeat subunit C [Trifolium pratense]|uniref:Serine/threonine protein phosphatase 6 regulatory ankyrin repeat subunit C n=1 Tax=Trifolium pratense TaxID=57577 RepID=A0A2K3MRV4_TRIPR|nr:serine/threonine protein phosphatase 6 regulatory ankyrin repeat subunit C [Trifolium pratense]
MAWLEYTKNVDDLEDYDGMSNMLEFVRKENAQGNTMLHEAMLCGNKYIGRDMIFQVCELHKTKDKCCYEYALDIVNDEKQSVLYLAVENEDEGAVKLILEKCPENDDKPEGLSPVVAAIMKRNQEMLRIILKKKPTWTHLMDTYKRLPLHYASSIGFLQASQGGYVEVVKKLLEYCPDPTEMLDTSHERNILHIASNYGKHEMQLTYIALNSAGAKPSFRRLALHDKMRQSDSTDSPNLKQGNEKVSSSEQHKGQRSNTYYKDRVDTLILVSTLIITASVAACFAVPGEADGKAHNLYHAMFQLFIFFITISLFSSISSTIILFWATLGLTQLATFSLNIVAPLLGIALISLTLAFMTGLYTVISKLTWLANLFLVVTVIFVVLVILLYIILFLPTSSTRKSLRYISYYPFLFLAWLAE